ncbi:hypothetical protein [Flavobacterium sp.]
MKRYVVYSVLALFVAACSSSTDRESETSEFLGKWKLTHMLMDPGDGSGTYEPVAGEYTLEFLTNGSIRTNYPLCNLNVQAGADDFTFPYIASENRIPSTACDYPEEYSINYHIDGGNLILSFPCIEGCLEKFERIEAMP